MTREKHSLPTSKRNMNVADPLWEAVRAMENALNPEEIGLVAKVVRQACAQLGKCDQAMKDSVNFRVTSSAITGERDFDTLLSIALSRYPISTPPTQT